MAVPDYQSFMLPILRMLGDGEIYNGREINERIAEEFQLTEEDKNILLPSGRQKTYVNRIGWARTYLKKAGLIQSPSRGRFQITERGLKVLSENPPSIDVKFLQRFDEFVEFLQGNRKQDENAGTEAALQNEEKDERTPEEILESSYEKLRMELASELLEKIKSCSPSFFEKLVIDLLVAMGYGGSRSDAGRAIGRSGDEGIDGIINEDRLGLDVIYVQAKRWSDTVGRPVVQAFAGSLEGKRAKKGILITTSKFSKEAHDYVNVIEKKIVLIDGERLAQLMIDYNVGVSEVASYTIKRIDTDYFEEEDV